MDEIETEKLDFVNTEISLFAIFQTREWGGIHITLRVVSDASRCTKATQKFILTILHNMGKKRKYDIRNLSLLEPIYGTLNLRRLAYCAVAYTGRNN